MIELTNVTIYGGVAVVSILIIAFIIKKIKAKKQEVSGMVKEVRQVLKFIPSELTFSVIYNHDETQSGKSLLGISKGVHAIVKTRRKVSTAFDLSQVKVKVDNSNKVIKISNIPNPEYLIEAPDYGNHENYLFKTINKGGTWLTGSKIDSKKRIEIEKSANKHFEDKIKNSKAITSIAKKTLLEMLQAMNDNYVESGWGIDWDDSLKLN